MKNKLGIRLGVIGGTLISVCGVIEKIGGFVEKVVPIPSWLWLVFFLSGVVLTFIFICWDKIVLLFTPDISWRNDGFAYMTIEARFRDNFNKIKDEDKVHIKGKGKDYHYADFCKEDVMSAEGIMKLFPNEDQKDEYRAKLQKLMAEYNLTVKTDIQYLFANTPFIFAEHYYFYHILKLCKKGVDPWQTVKENSLQNTVNAKENNRIVKLIGAYKDEQFDNIIDQSVFANSTDLSQTTAKVKTAATDSRETVSAYVVNDREKVQRYCKKNLNDSIVHIVVDNSGIELISDLIFGAYLINNSHAKKVIYHHNVLPIFVSDAVSADFDAAINAIKKIDSAVGESIVTMKEKGQMEFVSNAFWNMPFPFKEMPEKLLREFNDEEVGLIIIKGDLNYRRLVEDKKWRITKSIKPRVSYFEKPLLILRSLKSDTLLGIDGATARRYDTAQPNWKTTGDYGMIQFIEK